MHFDRKISWKIIDLDSMSPLRYVMEM